MHCIMLLSSILFHSDICVSLEADTNQSENTDVSQVYTLHVHVKSIPNVLVCRLVIKTVFCLNYTGQGKGRGRYKNI